MAAITNDWLAPLEQEFGKPYYRRLYVQLKSAYSRHDIYPPIDDIFRAFELCPLAQVKVVILGQDPYHGPGQAQGLAFSVPEGIPAPPSLVNVLTELKDDLGIDTMEHTDLSVWARRGVLLLNSYLTVQAHRAASHRGWGWEYFTDAAISAVNALPRPIVFMLWGNDARKKRTLIDNPAHLLIESSHPSPLSVNRGFFGSKPFSRANAFLAEHGEEPVNWRL
jgi:uracil-DNA glycosylase